MVVRRYEGTNSSSTGDHQRQCNPQKAKGQKVLQLLLILLLLLLFYFIILFYYFNLLLLSSSSVDSGSDQTVQ